MTDILVTARRDQVGNVIGALSLEDMGRVDRALLLILGCRLGFIGAHRFRAGFPRSRQRRLPRFLFEYIDGGSYAEVTLRRNVSDLAEVSLRQRVLRDVSALDLTAELFGQKLAMPLALGPVGLAGMYARRGEVQAARAAQAAGVQFTLSTVGCCPLREVSAGAERPIWFQLYATRDRGFVREMIAQAVELQCPVLLFTVDLPVPGSRYRDVHSGLTAAPGPRGRARRFAQALGRPRWLWHVGINGRRTRSATSPICSIRRRACSIS